MYCWGGSHGYACLKPKTHPEFGSVLNLLYKQVRGRLGCEIATLAQCDHLFDMWAHGFRFRDRGLDPLFHNQRSHQIPQQRSAVRSIPSKLPASYFVTHSKNLKSFEFQVSSFGWLRELDQAMRARNSKPET